MGIEKMSMKVSLSVVFCLPVLVASCASSNARHDAYSDDVMGWMQGSCLAIKNPDLEVPSSLAILPVGGSADDAINGIVTGRADSEESCPPLMQDRASVNKANGYYFYSVRAKNHSGLAVGIIGDADVDGLKVASCTTSEGVRFTVSSKKMAVWKGYYYMGYDMRPTCQSDDVGK